MPNPLAEALLGPLVGEVNTGDDPTEDMWGMELPEPHRTVAPEVARYIPTAARWQARHNDAADEWEATARSRLADLWSEVYTAELETNAQTEIMKHADYTDIPKDPLGDVTAGRMPEKTVSPWEVLGGKVRILPFKSHEDE